MNSGQLLLLKMACELVATFGLLAMMYLIVRAHRDIQKVLAAQNAKPAGDTYFVRYVKYIDFSGDADSDGDSHGGSIIDYSLASPADVKEEEIEEDFEEEPRPPSAIFCGKPFQTPPQKRADFSSPPALCRKRSVYKVDLPFLPEQSHHKPTKLQMRVNTNYYGSPQL